MIWVNSFEELCEFLATIIIFAPDSFPNEDYLPDEKQLNLMKAYDELFLGLKFISEKVEDDSVVKLTKQYLEDSKRLYEEGNESKATKTIQELREILRKYR